MDKNDKAVSGLGASGLIAVALLTGGAWLFSRPPLESGRPDLKPAVLERHEAVQDIDARLWQDPFDAVAKARETALKSEEALGKDRDRHTAERLIGEFDRPAVGRQRGEVIVAAVMLSSGPYADAVESRLRTRYAVLSGLKARGFVPADSEHLGYYYPKQEQKTRKWLPEVVPFEFFEPESGMRNPPCKDCRLLVLWLDGAVFGKQPLSKLATLAEGLRWPGPPPQWRVLGPFSSDGLRALVEEASAEDFSAQALRSFQFRFFSAGATATDEAMLKDIPARSGDGMSAYLADRGVTLLRSIGTDDRLARALVSELELRGLRTRPPHGRKVRCPETDNPSTDPTQSLPSTIAIVSEADTLYGRSLRQQFRYDADKELPGFCVQRWHYFRGIDGRLPGDAAAQRTAQASPMTKKDGKADSTETIGRTAAYDERPEGASQVDYLRRLAISMRDKDASLRRQYGREYGIRAIGVLGNDVYDKLLVLNALQAQMPHAIFFTTDMDARLFHPREQKWARNLIVASNFGLKLDDMLQRDIAPFRDSYQTSTYLATLLLLGDDVNEALADVSRQGELRKRIGSWFDKPRVFEVTRSGVFDFSDPGAAVNAVNSAAAADDRAQLCGRRHLVRCRDIHPDGSPLVPSTTFVARWLVFAALTTALWLPALALSRGARQRLRDFVGADAAGGGSRPQRMLLLGAVFVALAVGLPLLLAWGWPALADGLTRDGKPLSFSDGISPWPTHLIRLGTLVLCLYLVAHAWKGSGANADAISRYFVLEADRTRLERELEAERDAQGRRPALWRRLLAMLQWRAGTGSSAPPAGAGPSGMSASAELFWKHYLLQNRDAARAFRIGIGLLLMIVLSLLVIQALGDAPIAPLRGPATQAMQQGFSAPVGLAVLFLLLFVADATTWCVLFVIDLRHQSANWPAKTLQAFVKRTGVPREYLGDWIDLLFIARRTAYIGRLIYYPFIVLSLLLLARSSFFDDWYTPPGVWVLATLNFAIVLACAFALRHAAETSRQHALKGLQNHILKAKGRKDKGNLVSQLELLRTRMQNLSEGAFAPYSQQPLLKAVLLPLMTFGGSSLFDYLAMANL